MKPPLILIDELSDPDQATWVEFFDTAEALCTHLEPWFIDEPHVILDATGARLGIVRREYAPTDKIELTEVAAPARPDIVRKFLIESIHSAIEGRGATLAELVPSDLQSSPLETLWDVRGKCVAWHKANPPSRRSLREILKSFMPRSWQ